MRRDRAAPQLNKQLNKQLNSLYQRHPVWKNHTLENPRCPYDGGSLVYGCNLSSMTDPVEDTRPGVSLETERPERVIVQPSQDSKLEALHSLYNTLKQEETEAKRKFRELKSAITAELEALYPGDERPSHAYVVPASMYGPELTVYYKSQDYMPDSVIREHFPDIWEAFKKEKHFSEVREKPAGRPRGRK